MEITDPSLLIRNILIISKMTSKAEWIEAVKEGDLERIKTFTGEVYDGMANLAASRGHLETLKWIRAN